VRTSLASQALQVAIVVGLFLIGLIAIVLLSRALV